MLATRDHTAEIRIFYTTSDLLNGRQNKMEEYFKRHGWSTVGGCCADMRYKGIDFTGSCKFTKGFTDLATMESEISDIEAAFNDDYVTRGGAYNVHHHHMEPFTGRVKVY